MVRLPTRSPKKGAKVRKTVETVSSLEQKKIRKPRLYLNYGFFISLKQFLFQSFQPPLHLRFAAAHLVTVDAELARDVGLRESFPHIAGATGQAAALVGGEGDDGLVVQVILVEEGEHHLREGAPPDGSSHKHHIVVVDVHTALEGGLLAFALLLLRQRRAESLPEGQGHGRVQHLRSRGARRQGEGGEVAERN